MRLCKACRCPLEPEVKTSEEEERESRMFVSAFTAEIAQQQAVEYILNRENAPPESFVDVAELCDQCRIECTRLTRILELPQRTLTGREEVEIIVEHQALVVRMSDEELEAHITDLDRKVAAFRVKAIDARRERSERERIKYAKFSPEEIERLKAEQRMKKIKRAQPDTKVSSNKREAAIQSMVKCGVPREAAEKWYQDAVRTTKEG